MKTIACILMILVAARLATADDVPVQLRSVVSIGDERIFSVSTEDGTKVGWVSIGERFHGYEIEGFSAEEDTLTVSKEGKQWRVPLAHAAPIVASPEVTSASGVEDILQSVEEILESVEDLPTEGKLETVMRFAVTETAVFSRRIESARSPEEVASIIEDHSKLVVLGNAALDNITADLPPGEEMRLHPIILGRIPDSMKIGAQAAQLVQDLKEGKGHGSDPRVQSAIRKLEAANYEGNAETPPGVEREP